MVSTQQEEILGELHLGIWVATRSSSYQFQELPLMFLVVSGLVGEKQDDGLQALLSTLQGFEKTLKVTRRFPAVLLASHETVDIVTQKEVVAFRWKATIPAHSKFELIQLLHLIGSYK